ncbi:hypothetical protein TSAR_010761 [Trichomalopsis sarcophagae]|uniref:Venom dipeptidyl peptidase 4 n=1 Tax=Trichomalopsis sarcophagae TaxID=543379 RepID=A0A232ETT6_9HYME|nr:hypothetical protein TSAR_010761 [Trichomalopsis sarcophagae]
MVRAEILGLLCLQLIISTSGRTLDDQAKADTIRTPAPKEKKVFSLDDVISNAYTSDSFNGSWISETEIFYRIEEALLKFDVTTKQSEIIAKDGLFDDVSGLKFYLSPDRNYVLIRNLTEKVYRHSSLSVYSIYTIKNRSVSVLADGKRLSTAFWAPQGSALVYVLDNDIYYHQLASYGVETRRITFDGKQQAVYNGVPDWVYEEEVLGTDRAMWFSPNGEHLAFATMNDTEVVEAVIVKYGRPGDLKNQYTYEEKFRYPKPGTKNPQVTLNLVDLTDHGSSLISLKAPTDIVGNEPILYAVTWFDRKTVVATWTNRLQNVSQLASYSLAGQWQPLLTQEVTDGWLLSAYTGASPIYYKGYVFLVEPQPIGNKSLGEFGHVTSYRLLNGVLDHELDLTPGATWVHALHGVNDVKRVLYYTASPPGQPSQKQLYEVSLDASKDVPATPKCLSCELKTPEGNTCKYVSSVAFSKDFSNYVLTCSGPDPATVRIYDLEGKELFTWADSRVLRLMIANRVLPQQRNLEVESNGFNARVRLLLPQDFDPAKKYPMLVNVYAGPDSQRINDGFSVGFETYMSTNRHVIHAWIDGRGSSSKGTAMIYAVYRNLGSAEMEDQINVSRKLQKMFPWIDKNKTAIWGWSYGGYSTASILTKDDDSVFKCGISVAPVTNWIYYDSIYTERFMGLPTASDNLKNYQASGVMSRVEKLRGKKFMLVHGTGDDNVHYQQSMALSRALAEADILYDQVSYPDEAHHLGHVTKHLYHTMDKFWSECFGYKR